MAGIRNKHAAPPRQKEAVLPEDLIAMLETLDRGTLRGLRDRAMPLIALPAACAAVDLQMLRHVASLAAVGSLILGLVREAE